MQIIKKILYLLSLNERKRALILLIMILIMASLELIGVVSILPFMALLTEPSLIETNNFLNSIFNFSNSFGVETIQDFLFVLGVVVLVFLIFSLSFKAFTTYVQLRFVKMREYSIGKRLIEGCLHQPYSWFLSRNSADLAKSILGEVGTVVSGGILPLIVLISQIAIAIAMISVIIVTDPKLGFISIFTIGLFYSLIVKLNHNFLKRIGQQRLEANKLRFMTVNESFSAAKEVKVMGLEQFYLKKFNHSSMVFVKNQAYAQALKQLPRYILEAIAFGGMILVILYLMSRSGSFNKILPILSVYAFAGYKLIPALQNIYASITQLRFVGPAIDSLTNDLNSLKPYIINKDKGILPIKNYIKLENIHYHYSDSSKKALKNISIKIPARTTIGLVGSTGCGKTTLVDLILGLHQAQKGIIQVDDQIIDNTNVRAWQRSIGYVPQNIFLSDDTVSANIAFGVHRELIDQEKVEKAAKIANIHEFIVNDAPQKYQTFFGERGIRISGGQRQRIGIARALYHNPNVLILDEATSALDNYTELSVMEAINKLSKNITIIIIAHRLNTLEKCDLIFQLEKGEIVRQGNYEEFIKNNKKLMKNLEEFKENRIIK